MYVVDSLRHDRTPFVAAPPGVEPALAPAFEELARDALVYEQAASSSLWTRPSVASVLTGRGPSPHGVLDRQDRLPSWVPRVQQAFGEAGWFTVEIWTNPNILPVFGFLDGFDRFIDADSGAWLSDRGYEKLARILIDVVRQKRDMPLFLYMHGNEAHAPYRPLPKYRAMFDVEGEMTASEVPSANADAEVMARGVQLQRATIRSTSDRFGVLVQELRELGRYDDAVIVLTGRPRRRIRRARPDRPRPELISGAAPRSACDQGARGTLVGGAHPHRDASRGYRRRRAGTRGSRDRMGCERAKYLAGRRLDE